MTRKEKIKNKILKDIELVIGSKLFNFNKKGTITEVQKQILFEALGFQNLINYSIMPIEEIKKHWDESNLAYM